MNGWPSSGALLRTFRQWMKKLYCEAFTCTLAPQFKVCVLIIDLNLLFPLQMHYIIFNRHPVLTVKVPDKRKTGKCINMEISVLEYYIFFHSLTHKRTQTHTHNIQTVQGMQCCTVTISIICCSLTSLYLHHLMLHLSSPSSTDLSLPI